MVTFNREQLSLMKSLNLPFDVTKPLNDIELLDLDERVTDCLQTKGIDADDNINHVGRICESILDILAE